MSLHHQILQDAPAGYWPLDELSGTVAADASGNGKTGTLTNGPVVNQAGPAGLKAVDFDGVNDYLTASMGTVLDVTQITFEAWVNLDAVGPRGQVLGASRHLSSGTVVRFSCSFPTALDRMEAWNGSAVASSPAGSLSPVGKWMHLAWVWDNSTVAMYADGVLLANPALTLGTATAQPFVVGGGEISGATPYMVNGRIALAAVYTTALSAARIKAHYEAGIRSGIVAGPGTYGGSAYGTVPYGGGTGAENTTPLVFTEASLSLTATGDLTASSAQFAMHDANLVFNAAGTVGLDPKLIHEARLVLHG